MDSGAVQRFSRRGRPGAIPLAVAMVIVGAPASEATSPAPDSSTRVAFDCPSHEGCGTPVPSPLGTSFTAPSPVSTQSPAGTPTDETTTPQATGPAGNDSVGPAPYASTPGTSSSSAQATSPAVLPVPTPYVPAQPTRPELPTPTPSASVTPEPVPRHAEPALPGAVQPSWSWSAPPSSPQSSSAPPDPGDAPDDGQPREWSGSPSTDSTGAASMPPASPAPGPGDPWAWPSNRLPTRQPDHQPGDVPAGEQPPPPVPTPGSPQAWPPSASRDDAPPTVATTSPDPSANRSWRSTAAERPAPDTTAPSQEVTSPTPSDGPSGERDERDDRDAMPSSSGTALDRTRDSFWSPDGSSASASSPSGRAPFTPWQTDGRLPTVSPSAPGGPVRATDATSAPAPGTDDSPDDAREQAGPLSPRPATDGPRGRRPNEPDTVDTSSTLQRKDTTFGTRNLPDHEGERLDRGRGNSLVIVADRDGDVTVYVNGDRAADPVKKTPGRSSATRDGALPTPASSRTRSGTGTPSASPGAADAPRSGGDLSDVTNHRRVAPGSAAPTSRDATAPSGGPKPHRPSNAWVAPTAARSSGPQDRPSRRSPASKPVPTPAPRPKGAIDVGTLSDTRSPAPEPAPPRPVSRQSVLTTPTDRVSPTTRTSPTSGTSTAPQASDPPKVPVPSDIPDDAPRPGDWPSSDDRPTSPSAPKAPEDASGTTSFAAGRVVTGPVASRPAPSDRPGQAPSQDPTIPLTSPLPWASGRVTDVAGFAQTRADARKAGDSTHLVEVRLPGRSWADLDPKSPLIRRAVSTAARVVYDVPLTIGDASLQETAAGAHDAAWSAFGKALGSSRRTSVVRLRPPDGGDPNGARMAFRRAAELVRAKNALVKVEWTAPVGSNPRAGAATFPGADAVDIVGLRLPATGTWTRVLAEDGGLLDWADWARRTGKPVALHWQLGPETDAQWVRNVNSWIHVLVSQRRLSYETMAQRGTPDPAALATYRALW